MATVKEITTLCKSGNISEAYKLALADLEASPHDVWVQREMGWALYYLIKADAEDHDLDSFLKHLDELQQLDQLDSNADSMIFDNVIWKIAEFVKNTPKDNFGQITRIFNAIKGFSFNTSQPYSYILRLGLDFTDWQGLPDFIDWWGLDKLQQEDYQNFKMENGRKVMSLAERVYIAYSKVLLRNNDKEKILNFIPKIEQIVNDYPQMMYPGYFCGKLMLAVGTAKEEELEQVIPFAQKKKNEFWVWQLLSEIFKDEPDTQLACLLRAAHSRTQESFLVRVRTALVNLYVQRNDFARAKYQMDTTIQCYLSQGWNIPYALRCWGNEPWVKTTQPDSSDPIDYMNITNRILAHDARQSIAIVTYIDAERRRATIIYGPKQKMGVSLSQVGRKIHQGSLLKLQWTTTADGKINILGVCEAQEQDLTGITYIKTIDGIVSKMPDKAFAFVRGVGESCFVTPNDVTKYNLQGNEHAHVLTALNYNKKKDEWDWSCISLDIA